MWENLNITQVISAGEFWVVESLNSSDRSKKFEQFEEELNRVFFEKHKNGFLTNIIGLHPQQSVAVLYKQKWRRGSIVEKQVFKDHLEYHVFLWDYGANIEVSEAHIFALGSGKWSSEPYFARRVKLGHIVPITMGTELFDCKLRFFPDERFQWDAAATTFVIEIMNLSSMNKFKCQGVEKDFYIGEFYVNMSSMIKQIVLQKEPSKSFGKFESLGDILVACKYAVRKKQLMAKPNPVNPNTMSRRANDELISGNLQSKENQTVLNGNLLNENDDQISEEEPQVSTCKSSLQKLLDLQTEKLYYKASEEYVESWSPFHRNFDSLNHPKYLELTNTKPIMTIRRGCSNLVLNEYCELPEPTVNFSFKHILDQRRNEFLNGEEHADLPTKNSKTQSPVSSSRQIPAGFSDFWSNSYNDFVKLIRVYNSGVLAVTDDEIMQNIWDLKSVSNAALHNLIDCRQLIPNDLQLVMWPSIIRGRSCVAISREKSSGKTMGYVVPLISQILDLYEMLDSMKRKKTGPLAIIVCSTSVRAIQVSEEIVKLCGSTQLKVVSMYAGVNSESDEQNRMRLSIGVHVLVTTMQYLQRLGFLRDIAGSNGLTQCVSLERCNFLVYDDIEDIMKLQPAIPVQFLQLWLKTLTIVNQDPKQFIATATGWTDEIKEIMPLIRPLLPSTIISTSLDAAVAAKVVTKAHFIKGSTMHFQEVVDIISENRDKKILVFVLDATQAAYLKKLLLTIAVNSNFIDIDYRFVIDEMMTKWHGKKYSVFMVTDDVIDAMLDHDLRNADVIIHLCPPTSCRSFERRYSFMLDNFSTVVNANLTCFSHVILSEEVIRNRPEIVCELKKMETNLNQQILEVYDSAMLERHEQRKNRRLCEMWKAFGKCIDESVCPLRHTPMSQDLHDHLPISGEISFEIIAILSPIRFIIKLNKYRATGDSKTCELMKYHNIMFSYLQQYFSDIRNHKVIKSPVAGQLCAVKGSHAWVRADIVHVDDSDKILKCKIHLIDDGTTHIKSAQSLFELPENCCCMPPLTVEAFICDVKPVDHGTIFTPYANELIKEQVNKKEPTFYKGRIVLSLENTIWFCPIMQVTKIGSVYLPENFKKILLENDVAIDNSEHKNSLIKISSEFQLKTHWLSSYESCYQSLVQRCPAISKVNDVQPTYDIMESDVKYEFEDDSSKSLSDGLEFDDGVIENGITEKCELTFSQLPLEQIVPVEVAAGGSPDELFIIKQESVPRIKTLQDEINKSLTTCVPFKENLAWKVYLAPNNVGCYQRCKIIQHKNTESNVWFVDSGQKGVVPNKDILDCPDHLVTSYEAQAIYATLCIDGISEAEFNQASFTMNIILRSEKNWFCKALKKKMFNGCPMFTIDLDKSSNFSSTSLTEQVLQGLEDMRSLVKRSDSIRFQSPKISPTSTIKEFLSKCNSRCASDEEMEPPTTKLFELDNPIIKLLKRRSKGHQKTDVQPVNSNSLKPNLPQISKPAVDQTISALGRGKFLEAPTRVPGKALSNGLPKGRGQNYETVPKHVVSSKKNIPTFWSQTRKKVTIKFFVGFESDFRHDIGNTWIYACLKMAQETYEANYDLYAEVIADTCCTKRENKYYILKIRKRVEAKWPRLLSEIGEFPWIKIDETDLTSSEESLAPIKQKRYEPPSPKFIGGKPEFFSSTDSLCYSTDTSDY